MIRWIHPPGPANFRMGEEPALPPGFPVFNNCSWGAYPFSFIAHLLDPPEYLYEVTLGF